jgi:hypothetical protein
VLAVVEQEQERARAQMIDQHIDDGTLRALVHGGQQRGDGVGDELRPREPCQFDEEHTVRELGEHARGGLERKPGLAASADTREREQRRVG